MTPRDRYHNDAAFRNLVDTLLNAIMRCDYTPGELRQAAILASIIHLETTPVRIFPDVLEALEKWEREESS